MSWINTLSKNLINNVNVNIGDNKTIAKIIDGKLIVNHFYKNLTIIQKQLCSRVVVINTITSHTKDINTMSLIHNNHLSTLSEKSTF